MRFPRPPRAVLLAAALLVAATLSAGCTTSGDDDQSRRPAGDGQSATLLMHPQLAQPGTTVASADQAESSMSAVFKPARKGRKAVLQRLQGERWTSVADERQNGRGIVEFNAPALVRGEVQTYRVVAAERGALTAVESAGVQTSKWGAADFTDEFSGSTLDATWSHRGVTYEPASQRACSKADARAVTVTGGAARLSVLDDPDRPSETVGGVGDPAPRCSHDGQEYEWRLNGHIGTAGKESFTYGYAAARMRFQDSRGQHSSFWMQPQTSTPDNPGAEIDVIEWFGNDHPNGGLTSFVHQDDKFGGFIKRTEQYGDGWSTKYHVFSVEWTPERYIFRIDGKETFRTSNGVSQQPQYLILSLLSSDYELEHLGGEHKLPQHLQVDWVSFWQA